MDKLLSIVIPTKRSRLDELSRQAIASALVNPSDAIEVILHVDDDAENAEGVNVAYFSAAFNDSRLHLFVHPKPLTMTQNWEMAIGKAIGEYVIIIGDDDSIRPEVLDFTRWAKENDLDNVIGNGNVQYYWPSYPQASYAGTLIGANVSNKMQFPDINKTILLNSYGPKMLDYQLQPEIYHGLVKREALERMKRVTGCYVGSLIPDLYFAFAFAPFVKKYALVDYPFSLAGYSMKGNSGKFRKNAVSIEQKNYNAGEWPLSIPEAKDFVSLYAKCKLDAYHDSGQKDLIANMRPNAAYAQCLLNSPHTLLRIKTILGQYSAYLASIRSDKIIGYVRLGFWIFYYILGRLNLKMPYALHWFERRHNVIYKKKPDFKFCADTIETANIKLTEWLQKNNITVSNTLKNAPYRVK